MSNQNYKKMECDEYVPASQVSVCESFNLREFCDYYIDSKTNKTVLNFYNMPPSLTIILEC